LKYSEHELAEIEQTKLQIQHVKDAMNSDWWKDTMSALEDELWATVDDLRSIEWNLPNLARICGKIYAIRAIMTDPLSILTNDETIKQIEKEL